MLISAAFPGVKQEDPCFMEAPNCAD